MRQRAGDIARNRARVASQGQDRRQVFGMEVFGSRRAFGAEIGSSATNLIDNKLDAAWVGARQNHSSNFNSNGLLDSPHCRPWGCFFGLSAMSKTLGLDLRICRLLLDPKRVLWDPAAARSFATNPQVLRGRRDKSRDSRLLEIEINDLRSFSLRKPTLLRTQSITRDAHIETGVSR